MDIAERRLPQDGRLSARVSGQEIDVRVSAVPAVHGETIVLRLLPKERQDMNLARLGFSSRDLARFSTRSEEHTSELQSLMRISYAVFCLKKKKKQHPIQPTQNKPT